MASDRVPNYELDNVVTDVDGVSEVQNVAITGAVSGNFTLEFEDEVTANIAHNASATAVREALEGISTIKPGDVSVTAPDGDNYRVTFTGDLANQNVSTLVAVGVELKDAEEDPVVPVVTVVTAGSSESPNAVKRGRGNADREDDVSVLEQNSPAAERAENSEDYE